MNDGRGNRLADGDVLVCNAGRHGGQRREVNPHEVARFFFHGALQEDAGFVGGPLERAEANTHAGDAIRRGQVAHLKNLLVNVVGDLLRGGRNRDAALIAVEGGELFVVLGEEVEPLEARRPGKIAVLFHGNGNVGAGDVIHVEEGTAVEGGADGASGNIHVFKGRENVGLHDLGEIDDGGIVLEPGGVGGILDDAVQAPGMDLLAVVVEDEGHESAFGFAALAHAGGGETREEVKAPV